MKVLKPTYPFTGVAAADARLERSSTGTYIDASGTLQTAAINVARFNYNKATLAYEGILFEPIRFNFLLNSTTLSSQSVSIDVNTVCVLSFYGSGTVSFQAKNLAGVTGTISVVGVNSNTRVSRTFIISSSTTTLTVSGTVQNAQLETISGAISGKEYLPTSWIPTTSVIAGRSADSITYSPGILSSSVTETVSEWNISTAYVVGNRVIRFGSIYEALVNNTGIGPVGAPSTWLRIGPSNVFACLDKQSSTSTVMSSVTTMQYALRIVSGSNRTSDFAGSIALLGLTGSTDAMYPITVTGVIRNSYTNDFSTVTKTLTTSDSTTVLLDGFTITGDVISVRIVAAASGTLSLSTLAAGPFVDLGSTQYGASAGIIDYSKKETDEFGTTTFVERAYSKRLNAQVVVPNSQLNTVQKLLYSLRATPAVWVGSDDSTFDEALTVYGFYRDFSTDIAYPAHSICNLEIEGLT